jgi:predicted glycoside hydrolase/deacetylase ChbG (UPF0249 family)
MGLCTGELARQLRTAMRRLFINADDFGLTRGVTDGIVDSILLGAVGSTSLMVCDPDALPYGVRQAVKIPGKVGLHLQLTDGVPCSEPRYVASLVGKEGRFPRSRYGLGAIKSDEVLAEWHAQVRRALECGIVPSHIDTHHHVHLHPAAFDAYVAIAKYLNVPARTHDRAFACSLRSQGVRCADYCEIRWCSNGPGMAPLISALRSAFAQFPEDSTIELMCHTAYLDADLSSRSTYCAERVMEMQLFCDPALRRELETNGILLVDRITDSCAEHTRCPAGPDIV